MWNVRSLMTCQERKGQRKRELIKSFYATQRPDILVLLEHWKTREETEKFFAFLGQNFQTISTTLDPLTENRKRGVSITFDKRKIRLDEESTPKISAEGWFVMADFIEIANNQKFSVTALHSFQRKQW